MRNGTITGFSSCVGLFDTSLAVVEKLRADCADVGIGVGGSSTVSGNIASGPQRGILAGGFAIVSGNIASATTICHQVGDGSIISDNVAWAISAALLALQAQ